jgi:membrane-associated HD superfamily phosphohydrolase
MSILNDPLALLATASLITEIIVLFLLVFGYSLKRRVKIRQHGITMAAAVVLHLITIFAIMIPAFVLVIAPEYIIPAPLGLVSAVGLMHGVTGILAIALGIWLVGAWHFSEDVKGCYSRKKFMLGTFIIWVIGLIFGIVLYAYFYGAILIS